MLSARRPRAVIANAVTANLLWSLAIRCALISSCIVAYAMWILYKPTGGGPANAERANQMETGLQVLIRDGAVSLRFHPHLTVEQYAELLTIVENATTRAELCYGVEVAVEHWGI